MPHMHIAAVVAGQVVHTILCCTQVQLYYKNEMSVTDHIVLNGNALIPHKNIRISIKKNLSAGQVLKLVQQNIKNFKIIITGTLIL